MVKIIDCTIRDGGHLNGWNFSDEFVRAAYDAAARAGADYFEIGYRFANPQSDWGKWARCDELPHPLTPSLKGRGNLKLCVMADVLKSDVNDFPCVSRCSQSRLADKQDEQASTTANGTHAVRVATRAHALSEAFEFCENLIEKNYEVFLNLTQVSQHDLNKLTAWRKDIPIYLADSFGELTPDDVERIYEKLQGFEKICFHGHGDNALTNTLKAVELGFYSVDVSVRGLGRGENNLPAEVFLPHIKKNPQPYLDFINSYF